MARGSVFNRSGGWAYKVDTWFHPETGKRRQKVKQGFRTKREAELALAEVQKTVIDGTVVSGTNLRVGEFLDEWLAGQEARLRPTTHYSYVLAAGRLKHHLGPYKPQALTPMQIEKFYAELLDHGGRTRATLSPKTVRNTHVGLRKALADAERLGLVARNAAAAVRGPSVSRREMTTWSSDQLKSFARVAERSRMRHAFTVLAMTGMRRSEVLGLRWRDVDLDAGQLAIVQTVTAIEGKIVIGEPKTAGSRRTVSVHDATVRALRQQRQLQAEERLAAGPAWSSDNDSVFRTELGDLVNPTGSRVTSIDSSLRPAFPASDSTTFATPMPRSR